MRLTVVAAACAASWLAFVHPAAAASDSTPPAVQITTPAANASVTGSVRISVRASDASGVQNLVLSIDGAPVASASGVAALDYDWDTTQGAEGSDHTVKAEAYDAAWNRGQAQISVTVPDLRAPVLAMLGVGDGAALTGTVDISLHASDATGVTRLVLSIDGEVVADRPNTTTLSYAWNAGALPETSAHTVKADAYDAAGNRGTQSVAVSIRDVSSPVITYRSPTAAAVTSDMVHVDVQASDVSGIKKLVLSLDGRAVAEQSAGDSLSYAWNARDEPSGTRHTLDTDAYDQIGHQSRVSREIVITDVDPPEVGFRRPRRTDGVYGLEMVEVAATDNKAVKHLALRIDGTVVREAFDSTGFTYLWETANSGVGSEPVLSVSAEDAAGNQSDASLVFRVAAERPGAAGARLAMPANRPDGDKWSISQFFADARNQGAQVLYWYLDWSQAAANPQALDTVMAELAMGGDTAVTFDLIHTTVLSSYPAPYQAFTDAGFAEAFSDYAAAFAVRYAPTYLFVGNEANIYLDSHPDEVDAFRQVIRRTREKVAATGAATRVGVTINYAGFMTEAKSALLRALADEADLVGYTAYGYRVQDSAIRFDDPAFAIRMLEKLPSLYPGKPYAVVETGWNTATRFASSEALQTDFVRLLRHHAERSQAEFIDLFLLQDGQDCSAAALSFSAPGSNPDPDSPEVQELADFLCHFGVRRSDGSAKGAWNYLGQTSWPVPEPWAAAQALVALGGLALLGRRRDPARARALDRRA